MVAAGLAPSLIGLVGLLVTAAVGQEVPEASSAQAEGLDKKLQALVARYGEGKADEMQFEISQAEANAYLRHRMGDRLPKGIRAPWVRFETGAIHAGAELDVALLGELMVSSPLEQLFSGHVPVELRARFQGEEGVGKMDLEQFTLSGIPLPKSYVQQIAATFSKSPSRPDGIRLEEPFPLPFGIRSARVLEGRVLLRQGVSKY
ncbi:MAG: hypothetical protein ACE5JI_15880 [Acidobacteriota bacterium]